jgi:endonuclease/exonuclease/phosphatase family metal-dependent hydrolase
LLVRTPYVASAVALGALLLGSQSATAAPRHEVVRPAAAALAVPEQAVVVMTYDIRDLKADGTFEGSGDIAPWSKRRVKQAALIKATKPDLIAISEASSYVGSSTTKRQIDSLRLAIGGTYRLARTEIPPTEPHSFRTGDYILYNAATYKPLGVGTHVSVGDGKWAAYDEFANKKTHAKLLFASTHLAVGLGSANDAVRLKETKKLVAEGQKLQRKYAAPIVYAGNLNAPNPKVGPGKVFHADGLLDAVTESPKVLHGTYNSDNDYLRSPPHTGVDIDHIYVVPSISVGIAEIVVKLHAGKFVGAIPSDHNPVLAHLKFPYVP